ncbi:hypothetical protein [Leuconostoc gasicomitatum]|uniref:hypothetical protein n=1 Tax=Leuconostoc gasicomitatum TaxID=115778 RepID=UPI001CC5615A|nr:hypothetical protein [Leuconostoc gasicomitatum]MBZ5948090.1 hypothetical protein [Leuconostoc gasicomitatum]MBZ5988117.1 hypothetical protein [Leuconostoc gasicomitatum]MBZ5990215.1 hypothetical protein [Leuconostoc gasicomitatum]
MEKKQTIYFELDVVKSRLVKDNNVLIQQTMNVTEYLNKLTKQTLIMPFQVHNGDAISGAVQSVNARDDIVKIYQSLTTYLIMQAMTLQLYMAVGVGDIDTDLNYTQDEALVNGSAVVLARNLAMPTLKLIATKQMDKKLGIQTDFKKAPILLKIATDHEKMSMVEHILMLVYEFELNTDKKRLIYSTLQHSENWRDDLPKLIAIKNSGFKETDTLKQIENRARMLVTKADVQAINNQLAVFEEK